MSDPIFSDQVQAGARHQRGEPLHELHRGEHDVGDAVTPWGFEFQDCVAVAVDAQAFV